MVLFRQLTNRPGLNTAYVKRTRQSKETESSRSGIARARVKPPRIQRRKHTSALAEHHPVMHLVDFRCTAALADYLLSPSRWEHSNLLS